MYCDIYVSYTVNVVTVSEKNIGHPTSVQPLLVLCLEVHGKHGYDAKLPRYIRKISRVQNVCVCVVN
jgi:hypothetical protein